MKSTTLAFLVALCVAAVPALAQERPLERESADPAVEQIGVDAEAAAGGGRIMTGTLTAVHADHVMVTSPEGVRHVQLGEVELPAGIQEGDRIIVEYRVTPEGVAVVESIRPWDERAEAQPTPAPTTPAPRAEAQITTVTGNVVEITDTEVVLLTERGNERFRLADVRVPAGVTVGDRVTVELTGVRGDQPELRTMRLVTVAPDVAVDTTPGQQVLPATASPLPLVGLLGLLALLGAATLRVLRA